MTYREFCATLLNEGGTDSIDYMLRNRKKMRHSYRQRRANRCVARMITLCKTIKAESS